MRKNIYFIFSLITFILTFVVLNVKGENNSTNVKNDTTDANYQIEEPGTITFTAGSKIIGKVEKPQVMIFLVKEKPLYKDITIEYSFKEEILRSLPPLYLTP